jgi:anthranilate/para-aminobenzoate synthase component II
MVGLYHSWAVETERLPESLWVTAKSADGIIMALEHQSLSVCGVQFHPESILTEYGKVLLGSWVNQFKT